MGAEAGEGIVAGAGEVEFHAEFIDVVEVDFDDQHLEQHLGGHRVEPVEQRLDHGIDPRRGADDHPVVDAVGENPDRRVEDAGSHIGRGVEIVVGGETRKCRAPGIAGVGDLAGLGGQLLSAVVAA
ncbi:hypothetical protein SDC9_74488 [bioreactor metagenome]|uniref:Uncharacterized protein n=1 Tax=bioreactor metagenome TaxID=1076179 RepID=A0A644YJA4_9ZZZZ